MSSKKAKGRSFVPKSLSFHPDFLKMAEQRSENLGYGFSSYVRRLIAYDIEHDIIRPDDLTKFRQEFSPKPSSRREASRL
jgi:hypothetical protein